MNKNKVLMVLTPIIVVLLIGVIFFPTLIESVWASVSGQASSCEDTPYAENCFCLENERKVDVKWLGVNRWSCENVEQLLIDPESETFEDDAISFTQSYLTENCGSTCTDLSCGTFCDTTTGNPTDGSDNCIEAVYGWSSSGARLVNIECRTITNWETLGSCSEIDCENRYGVCRNEMCIRPTSGTSPWRMEFFVESEDSIPNTVEVLAQNNYCLNPELTEKCTHQSICDYYDSIGEDSSWCIGDLPLDIFPNDYPLAITGTSSGINLGSGYPAPLP